MIDEIKYWIQSKVPAVFDNELSLLEYVGRFFDKVNEVVRGTNTIDAREQGHFTDLDTRKEDKVNITNVRKLSPSGDFTGTWFGFTPVQTDPGMQAIVNQNTSQLADLPVSVKKYGAKGDGIADDTAEIQAAIDDVYSKGGGVVFLPKGIYNVSSTLVLKLNVILIGMGAGAYFAGQGYDRVTSIRPTANFAGTEIIRVDPADVSAGLSYTYGIAIRDLLIDMYNVKDLGITAIKLMSLSNAENFENIRVINNNKGVGLHITASDNVNAGPSDGLNFSNLYFLPENASSGSSNPVLLIECGNELSFRDCKFQNSSRLTVGSYSALLSAKATRNIFGVTFDSCSFTGAETGVRIIGKDTDGESVRWVRQQNNTYENLKFGTFISGTASRPIQFAVIGTGNRFITIETRDILLGAYASNNQVLADDSVSIELQQYSNGNSVYGGDGAVIDNGSNNLLFGNYAGKFKTKMYNEGWTAPALLNGWVNTGGTYNNVNYFKDANNVVHIKGHVKNGVVPSSIFTLPAGYRPSNSVIVCNISYNGSASVMSRIEVKADGNVYASVGGNIEFPIDNITFVAEN